MGSGSTIEVALEYIDDTPTAASATTAATTGAAEGAASGSKA
jgi:hypothetical protein